MIEERELQRRRDYRGGLITIAVITLVVSSCIWREDGLAHNFDRVTRGMTDQQVIDLLGQPNWRGRCGTSDYYSFVEPIAGSTDCLVYASPLAPLNPRYPVVFLGKDNRVLDKYDFASP
jgi:hypothetical protein